jgi:hypothetical protein
MQAITHMLGEGDSGIENTRQRIIDAALRPFGQAGYVRASTPDDCSASRR